MRISDWSSDVCSSDLRWVIGRRWRLVAGRARLWCALDQSGSWRAAASRHTARPRALRRLHDSSVGAKARVSPFLLPPSWGWDAAVPYTAARAGLGVALGSTTMRNA